MDPVISLLLPFLAALGIGAVLGFFGGLFGIGGGIIAIPVLVLGFGMDQTLAQGTALAMMVPNLVMAWWRYWRRGPGGLGRGTLRVALAGTLTTYGAAQVAQGINPQVLQLVFAGFLVVVGLGQWRRQGAEAAAGAPPSSRQRLMPLVGVAGGGCMGLLGVGGGLVATPLLTGLFGLGQRAAQGVALAMVSPSSAAALLSYARAQRVDWPLGAALAVGGVLTVSAGVALAHALPERRLRALFGLMLIGTAGLLALEKTGLL
ncbi:sulfite exporter TauE/SafE family protein [Novispirillum itersonii]|uniref:Probable membrane transporter protein n=1 Tax=Novispirillum itersonii TaxID=189 RepID=A0A7W9ZF62_NOVIT|nr:sulfite exporter TauE/SafE family protein [Novispirillum itersonii]MBB6210295.1 hypothetical protein [Novispirillum itersonii]